MARWGHVYFTVSPRDAGANLAPASATVLHDHCHVARLVTARKPHRCVHTSPTGPSSPHRIMPGQHYVRSTIYPGHDVVDITTPRTDACCLSCASYYSGAIGNAAEIGWTHLAERTNRVASLRSLLFAGTLQNPELTFFPAPVDR